MSTLREIPGLNRCIMRPVDCEDFTNEPLWNDVVDNVLFPLAYGTTLARVDGKRLNGTTEYWFEETPVPVVPGGSSQSGASHQFSFELMHGQNRFRIVTEVNVPVSNYLSGGVFGFHLLNYVWSIAFKVTNLTLGTSAIILQVFRDKASYDSANAGGTFSPVTPAVVAPYFIDLQQPNTNFYQQAISFEQEWPGNIYPPVGQSHVCRCDVILNGLSTTSGNSINQSARVVYVDLKQILEPS